MLNGDGSNNKFIWDNVLRLTHLFLEGGAVVLELGRRDAGRGHDPASVHDSASEKKNNIYHSFDFANIFCQLFSIHI